MQAVAAILWALCGYACAEERRMRIRFLDGRGECSIGTARWFELLGTMLENVGEDCGEEVPIAVRRGTFEEILGMCAEAPGGAEDMRKDAFHEVLRGIDYLNIQDEGRARALFCSLAKRSLLGRHSREVAETAGGGPPAVTDNIHVRLLEGLAGAAGQEMRIRGTTAAICHPSMQYRGRYGDADDAASASVIEKIVVVPAPNTSSLDEGVLRAIMWFVQNMRCVRSLDLSYATLTLGHARMISEAMLRGLELRMCYLPRGALAILALGKSSLRGMLAILNISYNYYLDAEDKAAVASLCLEDLRIDVCWMKEGEIAAMVEGTNLGRCLRRLCVAGNKMGREDMVAVSRLRLEALNVYDCTIRRGCVSALGEKGSPLRDLLCELNISYAEMGGQDLATVSGMGSLESLRMRRCGFENGGVADLFTAVLGRTLRLLDISGNALAWEDIEAVSQATQLRELNMANCSIPPGGLMQLLQGGCAVRSTLEVLNISCNRTFSDGDLAALSQMEVLATLMMHDCDIRKGGLRGLGGARCGMESTLRTLDLSRNRMLEGSDLAALAQLGGLGDLSLDQCGLEAGCVVDLVGKEDGTLRQSLCGLDISHNRLGPEDIRALGGLGLERLRVLGCGLGRGSLVPLGQSEVLGRTLRKLVALENSLGEEDVGALSALTGLELVL